ncbi:hypothetical protein JGD17_24445 [Salmonella enterica subsp. enterica serovar Rissen]|nr:hypothetical protein [Salmonella enterica subsp. enterica serovar Rissen]
MSLSDDIWQDIQFGSLEPFCRDGFFPSPQTFSRVFWEQYVAGGNAGWDDYRPALNELVYRGYLKQSQNGWYVF